MRSGPLPCHSSSGPNSSRRQTCTMQTWLKLLALMMSMLLLEAPLCAEPHVYYVVQPSRPNASTPQHSSVYVHRPARAYAYGYFGAAPQKPSHRSFRSYRNYTQHPAR